MAFLLAKMCKVLTPLLVFFEEKYEAKSLQSDKWSHSYRQAQFFRAVQFVRLFGSKKNWSQHLRFWMHNTIELDIRLREVVQREAFLTEQCKQLSDLLPSGEPKQQQQQQLDEWHAELQTLNQDYWCIERKIYAIDMLQRDVGLYSVLYRAYISSRRIPQWYLCEWLCMDCAKRGGCCGRACRCCEKPRSALRSNGHGHCTKTCGCCLDFRGFKLNEEQQKLCQPAFNLNRDLAEIDKYSSDLLFAYIFTL